MNERNVKKIEEQLEKIGERLANAEDYVARNVNVEGSTWLHLGDWQGKSGHPLWMKNYMIPTLMKLRARQEKALKNIGSKNKDKELTRRKRQGA